MVKDRDMSRMLQSLKGARGQGFSGLHTADGMVL